MSGFRKRDLRARVLVEAAPVDCLGAEVEAALDLDAIDVEAVARLDVGALLPFEIGIVGLPQGLVGDRREDFGEVRGRMRKSLGVGCKTMAISTVVDETVLTYARTRISGVVRPRRESV